jgi:hypothetical protein
MSYFAIGCLIFAIIGVAQLLSIAVSARQIVSELQMLNRNIQAIRTRYAPYTTEHDL